MSQTFVTFRRFVSVLGSIVLGALAVAAVSAIQASAQTTITGIVYAPNGTDPLPNILVYVASAPVQPFQNGPGADCSNQNAIVSGNPIAEAVTDYTGSFTLASTALTNLGTTSVNVVVQAGKWRQQYPSTPITAGTANGPLTLSMPATEGPLADLPRIAIVTGSVDGVECVLNTMGIQKSEFTDPSGAGHINLFAGTGGAGAIASAGSTAKETDLMLNAATLNTYDMVMFGCQGTAIDSTVDNATARQNLVSYANAGGRVFATHFEYNWLNKTDTFAQVADWTGGPSETGTIDLPDANATIDTSYADGLVLANWLYYTMKASPTLGQIPLITTRQDQTGVNPPTRSWATLDVTGNPIMQFTFDTPLGQATKPIVLVSFTNTNTNTNGTTTFPNAFVTGDTGDIITANVADQINSGATQTGLTIVFQPPPQITITGLGGGTGSGWSCDLPTLTCVETASIQGGATDPITVTINVPSTATPLGDAIFTAIISGGGISGTSQCGRVLYNEYHVENVSSAGGRVFPAECPGGTPDAQEKFLEYSLYNLSNFIAPVTADTIDIQAPSTTQINTNNAPGVTTPIYYGQAIGDTNGVNAIVTTSAPGGPDNGNLLVYVDTTLACTLPNNTTGGKCPDTLFTGQSAGPHITYATFTGDVDYAPSTSPQYPVQVLPDDTAISVTTSGSPSILGTPVTFTATATAPYATPTGPVTFLVDNVAIGTGNLSAAGVATFSISTIPIGTHSVVASYAATLDFNASTSTPITEVVTYPPAPTTTALTSSITPSYFTQNVTFTATVTATAPLAGPLAGTVAFYDGATSLGTSPLTSAGVATFDISTLTVGVHSMTAVFTPATPFPTAITSTSPVLSQVVNPNVFTLTVDPTSFALTVGSSVSVNITITDVGGFNEPVQLSCTSPSSAAEIACGFGELTVPAGGGATRLTFTPSPPHPCTTVASSGPDSRFGYLGFSLAALALFLARKRRLVRALALAVALCFLPLLNGCGTSGCTDFGVKPGTYVVTVTATSAAPYALTQTQNVTVTVNP